VLFRSGALSFRKEKNSLTTVIDDVALDSLFNDIRNLIEASKKKVALSVNSEMVVVYWHIGERIRKDILLEERAKYGKQIIDKLSEKLRKEYGQGYNRTNLFHMVRFSEVFSDEQIVHTLCRQLSWSHFRLLIYLNDFLQRDFYTERKIIILICSFIIVDYAD